MEVTEGHSVFDLTPEERRAALESLGVRLHAPKASSLRQAVVSEALVPSRSSFVRIVTVDEAGTETPVSD